MVEIGQRLWIHVVLNGQKQRVGCAVLRALQGSEMQRDEWCLPNNAGRLVNHGINHNVESFRRDMQNAGQNYDEILGQLLPEAGEETNSTIEDLLQWLEIAGAKRVGQSRLGAPAPPRRSSVSFVIAASLR
jgi:hypothetical protein